MPQQVVQGAQRGVEVLGGTVSRADLDDFVVAPLDAGPWSRAAPSPAE